MEDTLKHKQTVTNIVRKLQPLIQQLRYATKFLTTETMREQYYTHAYPHLIGSIAIWGTTNDKKTYMQPLIRTQKKLIRIIKNRPPRTHTKPIMKELNILNMTNLYILRVCLEMHPFIHDTEHVNRPEHDHIYIYASQIHEHSTRYATQQHHYIPNSNTIRPTHEIEYLTRIYTAVWNELPLKLKLIRSRTELKTQLKQHLLNKQHSEQDPDVVAT